MRNILLRYFEDIPVTIGLLTLVLASNLIQYVAIDNAQSHAYIFPLYVLMLYFTIKWHESPKVKWAALIGLTIGIATICRPTEIIMLFIPLLWNTHTKTEGKNKWQLVKKYRHHICFVLLFGVLGIFPQLIYWKNVTGSFVYDVGSKWVFLTPFFRGLFGWERGWFIYTPIAIFFVLGLFFSKNFPFKKSVIVFCVLNIWIVISWFDWKYGATYSSRALTQSYGVFALPFTALIQRFYIKKGKFIILLLGLFLISVNLFQIKQYNATILHYDDMNRKYYAGIYLNNNPTPLTMSLLDSENILEDKKNYKEVEVVKSKENIEIIANQPNPKTIFEKKFQTQSVKWINIKCRLKVFEGFGSSYLEGNIIGKKKNEKTEIRIFSPISESGECNDYEFYCKIPEDISSEFVFQFKLTTLNNLKAEIESYSISTFEK